MEPVQVKLYGLFRHTKTSYLKQQLFSVLLALSLVPIWFFVPSFDRTNRVDDMVTNKFGDPVQSPDIEAKRSPTAGLSPEVMRMIGLLQLIPWIVGGLLILIALETCVVLRQFAKKEAVARQATAAAEPAEQGP